MRTFRLSMMSMTASFRGRRALRKNAPTRDRRRRAMPLATLRQVLDEAAKGGYGVGAFNANNMEQVQGIVAAAQEVGAPVIVQVSRGALSYAGKNYLRHLITAAAETAPEIPIVLHLDHGDKPETCFDAIELGFTSVMMDGSLLADGKTPSDYEYNVEV